MARSTRSPRSGVSHHGRHEAMRTLARRGGHRSAGAKGINAARPRPIRIWFTNRVLRAAAHRIIAE